MRILLVSLLILLISGCSNNNLSITDKQMEIVADLCDKRNGTLNVFHTAIVFRAECSN